MPTIDHRGPEIRGARPGDRRRDEAGSSKRRRPSSSTVFRDRSVGGGPLEHLIAGRSSYHVRDRSTLRTLWHQMASRLGLDIEFVPGDWRHGSTQRSSRRSLTADRAHRLKAVLRRPQRDIDRWSRAGSPKSARRSIGHVTRHYAGRHDLLACFDRLPPRCLEGRRHCGRGRRRAVMLPPGLGFNAVSRKGARGV